MNSLNVDMKNSVRRKLFYTKHKLKESSENSDYYVRLFNRSLKENYNKYLILENNINEFFYNYKDFFIIRFLVYVGKIGLMCYKKVMG